MVALGVFAASAVAGRGGPATCSGGDIATNTYAGLTITGNCTVPDGNVVTVLGNLILKPGSSLDAVHNSTVNVTGNVLVGKGATLGLGCTPASNDPEHGFTPCSTTTSTQDTVGGNIVANQPLTMYLDGDTIHGNVVSNGGGPGLANSGGFINFPIKDNTIYGNLIVHGWEGFWLGVIRDEVHGNVMLAGNSGVNPDSTEVSTNTITGNLICLHNTPAAQFGDAAPIASVVGGKKIGECALNGL